MADVPLTATLTVSGKDLQVIYLALDELPGKLSRELFAKLSAQVQAQIDAATKEPPAPPAG